jgi:hypothetical protein
MLLIWFTWMVVALLWWKTVRLNFDVALALLEETGLVVEVSENGKVAVGKPPGRTGAIMTLCSWIFEGCEVTPFAFENGRPRSKGCSLKVMD